MNTLLVERHYRGNNVLYNPYKGKRSMGHFKVGLVQIHLRFCINRTGRHSGKQAGRQVYIIYTAINVSCSHVLTNFSNTLELKSLAPVPTVARPKAYVCRRSPAETVGSNPTRGMDVYLLLMLYVVS